MVMKVCLLLSFVLISFSLQGQWIQKGLDIDGEAAMDLSGHAVSLSADGKILAIGAYNNDGSGPGAGHVRIYEWIGTAWVQKGADIDGEAAMDASGISVSLNSAGNTVAIGALFNDGAGSNSGHVRVFAWDGSAWTQRGSDIDGMAADDESGWSVSLSANGNTVAIGVRRLTGSSPDAGYVRIFEWSGAAWIQKGTRIDGETIGDDFGWSVSLSADGNTVAIGARLNAGTGPLAGHVRVYEWTGTSWIQKGADLDGEAAEDQSGWGISLAADGRTLAIGAVFNDGSFQNAGQTRIYEWTGSSWNQKGGDIDGEGIFDASGESVSLTPDGNTVAIGATSNSGLLSESGHVRIYTWSGSAWMQKGDDIEGEAVFDLSGRSVSLSADGNTVAIGARENDGTGPEAGHVRVYHYCSTFYTTDTRESCDSIVWIDGNTYASENDTATYTLTSVLGCDSVVTLNLTIEPVDLTVASSGSVLSSNTPAASYRWLDCSDGFTAIPGATNQTFTASAVGSYAVEVSLLECVDTSECIQVTSVGIPLDARPSTIQVFPNPTTGSFTLDIGRSSASHQVRLYDMMGRTVFTTTQQTEKATYLLEESPGVYFISVGSAARNDVMLLTKE